MREQLKNNLPNPDMHPVMRHLGFNEEAVVMSCRKHEPRLFFYEELNLARDEKKNRIYSAHELVMELLKCDSDEAWRYLGKNGLL